MRSTTKLVAAGLTLGIASPALADEPEADEHGAHAEHAEQPAHAKQTIMPEGGPGLEIMEQFGFSEAVIHGDTVYLSGVIAGPAPEGMTREEAYDATFQYIGSVLARAGSSWDDVVDMTTYHVDIDASLPAIAAVKNKYVKAPFPAWTAIDIDRLFAPQGEVEIKVTARVTPATE